MVIDYCYTYANILKSEDFSIVVASVGLSVTVGFGYTGGYCCLSPDAFAVVIVQFFVLAFVVVVVVVLDFVVVLSSCFCI